MRRSLFGTQRLINTLGMGNEPLAFPTVGEHPRDAPTPECQRVWGIALLVPGAKIGLLPTLDCSGGSLS